VAVILCDCELDDRDDADALDAMTPDWPYSRAVPYEAASSRSSRGAWSPDGTPMGAMISF